MSVQRLTDEFTAESDPTGGREAVQVVIAYEDLAAAKRAMRVLAELDKGLPEPINFHPVPWSFEVLTDPNWRGAGTMDAVRADILVIATSGTTPFTPAMAQWVDDVIDQKRGTDAAIVALVGAQTGRDEFRFARLALLQAKAQQAGLAFFAPASNAGLNDTPLGLPRRAQLITPLLDQILHQPQAPLRWGINE